MSLALKSYGQIDGLVVNHAVLEPISRLENCSLEEFKRLFDVNLFSAFNIVREFTLQATWPPWLPELTA